MAPLISKRADIILILKPWTESLPRNAALCPGRLHERKVTEWFNLRTKTETLDSFCFSLFPVPLLFFPFPRFFFVYRTSMFEFNDSHQRPFAARKIEITIRPRISILAMRMNKIICKYIEIYRLLCYCVKTKAPTDIDTAFTHSKVCVCWFILHGDLWNALDHFIQTWNSELCPYVR